MAFSATFTASGTSYPMRLAPVGQKDSKGRGWTAETLPWEPGDPRQRFRIPLHPWDGGLNVDRLAENARSYAKGNCDASWSTRGRSGYLLWPPKHNAVTLTNGNLPSKLVNFNSKLFAVGGRYMYAFDPSTNTASEDKDFGADKASVDAAVFNNELIVAMGESEKIYKRSAAGSWTQASDNTYAIALGAVQNKLWRAETTNRLSYVTTTPLTLANWTPSTSGTKYYAGDATFAVNRIIDYGGIPWVAKGDGVYIPDPNSNFLNQLPQIASWPDSTNGKNMFVAQGSLWVPTSRSLYRLRLGLSLDKGPEVTFRPGYRFRVRDGIEFGDAIYLLCNDAAAVEDSVIIKMVRDTEGWSGREYIYHEWCRLGGTTIGYCLGVATGGTNPELVTGYGNDLKYIKLGRGGGRDPDDSNYQFGTSLTLESGVMAMVDDLSEVASPVGVTVACDISRSNESITISGVVDRLKDTDSYTDLQSISPTDGGGTTAATTTGFDTVTRYFDVGTQGQYVEVKITGAISSASGSTRPVIREAWVFGYAHPKVTDVVSCAIIADDNIKVGWAQASNALDHHDYLRLFKKWQNEGTELTVDFEDYDASLTRRFFVRAVQEDEAEVSVGKGGNTRIVSVVKVQLARVDRAGAYGT